jgi:hypothetical protein
VRLGLADDIHTPIELLEKLAEDPNPYVSYRAVDDGLKPAIFAGEACNFRNNLRN